MEENMKKLMTITLLLLPLSALAQKPTIDDSQLKALTTTIGGANVLPTTRTVPHWWGSTLDPDNGITYGYNMVGADPNNCSGSGCSVTVEADITPLIVNIDGLTFSGNNVLDATLASPQFALNDYGSTPFATADRGARAASFRRMTRTTSSSSRTRPCGRSSTRRVRATTT
jgi:hypothetical protein